MSQKSVIPKIKSVSSLNMNTISNDVSPQTINKKRSIIRNARKTLKREFVGINNEIDSIMDLVEPWFVLPAGQTRPLIINMWGLTGCGKTTLVRRIAELLDTQTFETDLAEFTENKSIRYVVESKMKQLSGNPCILLFDDIQIARTIGQCGEELNNPSIRGFWSILSDGKITIETFNSPFRIIGDCHDRIAQYQKSKDINKDKYNFIPYSPMETAMFDEEDAKDWSIFADDLILALKTAGALERYDEFARNLQTQYQSTMTELINLLVFCDRQITVDFTKSCIFICGNLDELYSARDLDPDMPIDQMHEKSKKITVTRVKNSLLSRFRAEQISRLGNNHIIYPIFKKCDYKKIIFNELENISKFYIDTFNLKIEFSEKIKDIIFKEGVFPTQGVRPILSTIHSIVDPSLSTCISKNIDVIPPGSSIVADYDEVDHNVLFSHNGDIIHFQKIDLKIEKFRTPVYDDKHVIVALHEAGHTVCDFVSGRCPAEVCAFTANVTSAGYTASTPTDNLVSKSDMRHLLLGCLGGRASELHFLGTDNITVGASADLQSATRIACEYIEKFGFNGSLVVTASNLSQAQPWQFIERSNEQRQHIEKLISDCEREAQNIINGNVKFVLDLANELLKNGKIFAKDIKRIAKRNGIQQINAPSIKEIYEKALDEVALPHPTT